MTRRLLLLVALVGAFLVVSAPGAHACSCAVGDPRVRLAQADAAFVGRPVGNSGILGLGSSIRFKVDWVLKGDLPPSVAVAGRGEGSACGLAADSGRRTGVLLYGSPGRWRSDLCSELDADLLLSGARPLGVDGSGPVRFLVAEQRGSVALEALDERGRTLGYGESTLQPIRMSACPSGRRAVTVSADPRQRNLPHLLVWDVSTLRVVRDEALSEHSMDPIDVVCRDADARDVVVAVQFWRGRGWTDLLQAGTEPVRSVARAPGRIVRIQGGRLWTVDQGNWSLWTAPLDGGPAQRAGSVPAATWDFVPSPDGRLVAGVTESSSGAPPTTVFVKPPGETGFIRSLAGQMRWGWARPTWIAEDRFALIPNDEGQPVVFDTHLVPVGYLGVVTAHDLPVIVGSTAYVLSSGTFDATLARADLSTGAVAVVRHFGTPEVFHLAAVEGDVSVRAAAVPNGGLPLGVGIHRPNPLAAGGRGLVWLWWLLPASALVALGYTVWWYFNRRPGPPNPPSGGSG